MIREIVRTQNEKLVINIPKEYIGKDLEILIFSGNEILKPKRDIEKKELLKEFEKINKSRIKPKIKYSLKMEDEINNDLF